MARLLALASMLVPATAVAQPTLVRGDVDGAGVRRMLEAVRACGGKAPRARVPARPEVPAPAPDVVETVRRARLLTLDAEFERAITELQTLYVALAREPARAGAGRIWAEALTVDAFARWSRAGGPEAVPTDVAARLNEAVALWPRVQVDSSVMPPPVERALEEARERRARRSAGEIAITDGRTASWVWVSGEPESARVVLRPAGRTIVAGVDAWGHAWARLIGVRPTTRVEVAFEGGRRAPAAEPPRGDRRTIVVGLGAEGAVAQRWPRGRPRVDVTRGPAALARRLGLCSGGGGDGVAGEDGDGSSSGTATGGSGALLYVLGAAALVAGGVTLGLVLTDEPVAEIRLHSGP